MKTVDPTKLRKPRSRCDMQKHLLEILCCHHEINTGDLARIARLTSSNASTMLRRMQDQRLVVQTAPAKRGPQGRTAKWQLRETYERAQETEFSRP